jgi:hypothetical protein
LKQNSGQLFLRRETEPRLKLFVWFETEQRPKLFLQPETEITKLTGF